MGELERHPAGCVLCAGRPVGRRGSAVDGDVGCAHVVVELVVNGVSIVRGRRGEVAVGHDGGRGIE